MARELTENGLNQRPGRKRLANTRDGTFGTFAPSEVGCQVPFSTVPQDQIHTLDPYKLLRMGLRITSGHDNSGRRISTLDLPYEPPGFLIGVGRHGTGVDDIDIRGLVEPNDVVIAFPREVLHDRSIELVDLAA
jgi:hypothetical protein